MDMFAKLKDKYKITSKRVLASAGIVVLSILSATVGYKIGYRDGSDNEHNRSKETLNDKEPRAYMRGYDSGCRDMRKTLERNISGLKEACRSIDRRLSEEATQREELPEGMGVEVSIEDKLTMDQAKIIRDGSKHYKYGTGEEYLSSPEE